MSVSNVNMFEFHDEEKANEWISWYNRDGPSGFSEAEVLLFVRTGPTSGLTISVYPDDNARQAGSEVRQKFQAQQADYVREITVFEGDVEVKHIRSDKPIISLATNCFVGVKNVISGEAKVLLT